jgi:folate-binding protein YgfZ
MTDRCVRRDASDRGRLVVSGSDAKDLLHRLATRDLASLGSGQGAMTYLLERSGRVVDRVLVAVAEDDLLLVGSVGRAEATAEWIRKHVITEDVEVSDATSVISMVTVAGPDAARALESAFGYPAGELGIGDHGTCDLEGAMVWVVRTENLGGPGFHVIVNAEAMPILAVALGDVPEVDAEAWTALRVESGVPEWGAEFDERTLPLELGDRESISFDKGCYVGQEVIARLSRQDRLKRILVRARLEGTDEPGPEAAILEGDRPMGRITSSAAAGDDRLVLAFVEPGCNYPGMRLVLRDGDRDRGLEILNPTSSGGSA